MVRNQLHATNSLKPLTPRVVTNKSQRQTVVSSKLSAQDGGIPCHNKFSALSVDAVVDSSSDIKASNFDIANSKDVNC